VNHSNAYELLPWYAANTLEAGERARVTAHLAACGDCQRELRALGALAGAVRDEAGEPAFDLGRLRGVMARLPEQARAPEPLLARLREWLSDAVAPSWQATPLWARAAVALQLAALLAVGGALLRPHDQVSNTAGDACAAYACIAVGFAPEATEAQLRALLGELDAEIVAGPSALGLYTLALFDTAPGEVDGLLAALRERRDLVRVAERKQ
jgi:anti-sigma factor RsiW